MNGQRSVVRLHNSVGYFWWWYNAECVHDSVGIFFSDLRNKEGSHAWAGSTAQWVCKLKALKAVAAFCFFSNDIQYRIYQLGSLSVVAFCPVVSSSALAWGETWRRVNSLCRYLGVVSFQTNLQRFIFQCVSIRRFYSPKTKLSGLKICPNGPERTESIVPGSKSTRQALGTYFPPNKFAELTKQ